MNFMGKELLKKEIVDYLEKCLSEETIIPLDDYISDRVNTAFEFTEEIFDAAEEIWDSIWN